MAIKTIGLLEEANDLGFESIEDALNGGYEIVFRDAFAHLSKKKGE